MKGFLAWQVLGHHAVLQVEEAKNTYVHVYIDARMRQDCEIHFLVGHASISCKILRAGENCGARRVWLQQGSWGVAGGLGGGWRDPAISFRMFNRERPDAMLCEGSVINLFYFYVSGC